MTIVVVGVMLLLASLIVPDLAIAADPDAAARALEEAMRRERGQLGTRLGIVLLAVVIVAAGAWRARSASGDTGARSRIAVTSLLAVVALVAFASYYDFFREKTGVGFKDTDVFHYYMGSKYHSEVGYFDLYHCTLMALLESGVESRFDLPRVRDQRTLRPHTPDTALAAARQCRAQFDDERWRAFAHDVAWFNHRFEAQHWHLVFHDHGYNPTPIWTALGGAVTTRVPVGSAAFFALIDADRFLIVFALIAIAWAFGFEAAALGAIVWGTGTHWGHGWIGDSLLRNLWLATLLVGLCLLAKKRDAVGGALIGLATLLRIFPGIFAAAFALGAWLRSEKDDEAARRLRSMLLGAAVSGGALFLWAAFATAWGVAAFAEFYEKMSVFAAHESLNKLGLPSLVWRSIMVGTGHLVTNAEGNAILVSWSPAWLPFVVRGVQLLVLVPALVWFWRAAKRLEPHETAALAFGLIPLLTDPANYYYVFFVCGALLAVGRPGLQLALLAASALWLANALLFYRVPEEYLGASAIAVALPLFFLYVLSREGAQSAISEAIAPGHSGPEA